MEKQPRPKNKFWNITASNLLTIGVLLAYWWLSRAYCLDEINSCYARLNNCTTEKFPRYAPINTSAFPSMNMSNFTSLNLTLECPCD